MDEKPDIHKPITHLLRAALEVSGKSQSDIAEAIGISRQAVNDYFSLTNTKVPKQERLVKIFKEMGFFWRVTANEHGLALRLVLDTVHSGTYVDELGREQYYEYRTSDVISRLEAKINQIQVDVERMKSNNSKEFPQDDDF